MPGGFYREPDAELSQGDVVDDIPQVRLAGSLEIIRRVTVAGKRQFWAPYPYPPQEGKTPEARAPGKTIVQEPFHVKDGEYLPVHARFTRAVVLNYDCDLVQDDPEHLDRPAPDHCLVAIVRPMTGVNEDDRQTIRDNRNFNYFFLPADADLGLEEGYADFRQITCLAPDLIQALGTRRASLAPLGVQALQAQLFRFLTRRDFIALTSGSPPVQATTGNSGQATEPT